MNKVLKAFLGHPLTKDLDLDDPGIVNLRRKIIQNKGFLRKIYEEWFSKIIENLSKNNGMLLEIGSGADFLSEYLPNIITSDIVHLQHIDLVSDGQVFPFKKNILSNIILLDVFHHLPSVNLFLGEVDRCLVPGGRLIMIEPWITPWSKLIYDKLHHEDIDTEIIEWSFPSKGPLSSANLALPWNVFNRDKNKFIHKYPGLIINKIETMMPVSYLLSGGISMRSLIPGFLYNPVRFFETHLLSGNFSGDMFAIIIIEKK